MSKATNHKTHQPVPLTIFYDGACHVCSREINHYQRLDAAGKLQWVNIAAKDFNAKSYGLDPVAVNNVMHVRLPSGEIVTGVDAFVAIWNEFPNYARLAKLIQTPVVYEISNVGYQIFARLRKFLPKRQAGYCATSVKKPSHSHDTVD